MRGMRIEFGPDGPRFDTNTRVQGFAATVQNALVNIGTDRGSDPLFPDRGTDLKLDGVRGRMSTNIWAKSSGNFAALRTLSFLQQTETATNDYKLQTLDLDVKTFMPPFVELNVQAMSGSGQTVGVDVTL